MITCRHEYAFQRNGHVDDVPAFVKLMAADIICEGTGDIWAANPDYAILRQEERIIQTGFDAGQWLVQHEMAIPEALQIEVGVA